MCVRRIQAAAGWPGHLDLKRKRKFKISQSIGESSAPGDTSGAAETLIVADGFSCREQIRQATGRKAIHFAEVLEMAMQQRNTSKA